MLQNISIESFYVDFEKHVQLVEAYTEKDGVAFLIRMCRLRPYDIVYKKYSEELILHRHWIDEYGNSLFILNKRNFSIKLNDLNLDRAKLVNSDLYGQLTVDRVLKISKVVYSLFGRDEDFLAPHAVIASLGLDDFCRAFVYYCGEWKAYPPLYLGAWLLRKIGQVPEEKGFRKLFNSKPLIYPCAEQIGCIGLWPPSNQFISFLQGQDETIISTLDLKLEKTE